MPLTSENEFPIFSVFVSTSLLTAVKFSHLNDITQNWYEVHMQWLGGKKR